MAPSAGDAGAMKLLLDEMWPPALAIELRARGHDAIAVAERNDLRGQPDSVIFEFAQEEMRTVMTEDVPGYRALATVRILGGGTHAGLIFTTNRRLPRSRATTFWRIAELLDQLLPSGGYLENSEHWLT
ncbi:MAG: hypothetical protein EXR51_03010 [Dehalococcoidia bacterium]|nr:hypothetical protein [Dehalococcoidia bacterium]